MSEIAVAYASQTGKITIRAESKANYSLELSHVCDDRENLFEDVTALAE